MGSSEARPVDEIVAHPSHGRQLVGDNNQERQLDHVAPPGAGRCQRATPILKRQPRLGLPPSATEPSTAMPT
jgi:hypothetical protein